MLPGQDAGGRHNPFKASPAADVPEPSGQVDGPGSVFTDRVVTGAVAPRAGRAQPASGADEKIGPATCPGSRHSRRQADRIQSVYSADL